MKKKTFNLIVGIVSIVLGLLVITNLYCVAVFEQNLPQIVSTILLSATSLFAIFYISTGYTKAEGARYFHMFMIAYAITMLFLIFLNRNTTPTGSFLINLIIYGCLCVLASAKDLGVYNSTILAGTILVLSICTFIFNFVSASETLFVNLVRCQRFLTSVATFLMVKAKYIDKKERGRK